MMVSCIKTLLVGYVVICSLTAFAAEITLSPVKDNTLFQDTGGTLSNGAGEYLFAGRVGAGGGGALRRALIAFDVAGAISPGSVITDATLRMNMSKTVSGPAPVTLHKITADWGEGGSNAELDEGMGAPSETGDATWIHRSFNNVFWTTAGGDFTATASATTSVNLPAAYTWNSAGLLADVISWHSSPASNFGWIIRGNEDLVSSAKRFDSRESLVPANRPTLTVTFTPPSAVKDWTIY